jgi:hypothetical protein
MRCPKHLQRPICPQNSITVQEASSFFFVSELLLFCQCFLIPAASFLRPLQADPCIVHSRNLVPSLLYEVSAGALPQTGRLVKIDASSPSSVTHPQDVAAACIFLATKTEECGRKLRDVAKIAYSKVSNIDVKEIPSDSKVCLSCIWTHRQPRSVGQEVDQCQVSILLTEEALLEALCFDFIVDSPHAELVDLFNTHEPEDLVQEYAWSLAHDSYVSFSSLFKYLIDKISDTFVYPGPSEDHRMCVLCPRTASGRWTKLAFTGR